MSGEETDGIHVLVDALVQQGVEYMYGVSVQFFPLNSRFQT